MRGKKKTKSRTHEHRKEGRKTKRGKMKVFFLLSLRAKQQTKKITI